MRRGVTLLEMLVAAILLSIGLLGALETIAQCAATTRGVGDRARAMIFARSKLEEILKEPILQTGSDRGEGVDTTTQYDWEATIEPSPNPSLVIVMVAARNRVTGTTVALSALRRPDLETPPQDATGATTGAGTTTGAGAAGGAL